MKNGRDPRVDAYIARAQPFAQPVLRHIRALVHKTVPRVQETIKWGVPAFEYKGPFCGVAAFKKHCMFNFWKAPLLSAQGLPAASDKTLARLASLDDLPPDSELVAMITAAAALNDAGVKVPRAKMAPKPPPRAPSWFLAALDRNGKARAAYDAFSPSHKREYIEWVTDAKTDATRDRRVAQAVAWMAEGKARNWKYM